MVKHAENLNQPNVMYNDSIGYYIVPFKINKHKYSALKKHLTKFSAEDNDVSENRFRNCRYVFKSIRDIYQGCDYFKIDFNLLKAEMVDGETTFEKILPLESADEGRRFAARVDEISAFLTNKAKGYLVFKINYCDMTLEQIESFAYFFRHIANSTPFNSTFAQVSCHILGVKDYEDFKKDKNDFVSLFYYMPFKNTYVCDVLQLICRKIPESSRESHLICLGRGYKDLGMTENNYIKDSRHDMELKSNKYATWVGSPGVLTCVLEEENNFTRYTQSNVENDHLCLYLTLQNQRHTLLYFMTDAVNNQKRPGKLIKAQRKLNDFKLAESFKVVSNEYSYQNIYDKMYAILDIDKLTEDISDVSANASEQKNKNIERLFSIFTVIAAIETFYNIFGVLVPMIVDARCGDIAEDFWLQIIIVVVCVGVSLLLTILCLFIPKLWHKRR